MTLPILLADRSACLRARVLRELLGRDAGDAEVAEVTALLSQDRLATALFELQHKDGSWRAGDGAWRTHGYPLMMTCFALQRLGLLGFDRSNPAVARGVEFLIGRQRADGAWSLPRAKEVEVEGGLTETPLQTAFPLYAITCCGYATEPAAERAYEWLLGKRLEDGAWPTGTTRGDYKGVAGYRRIAHSQLGCRSNTTAALQCLAMHPERRSSEAARRGLDLLLGRETRDAYSFGFDLARVLGAEPLRGFISFFARFDVVTILDLAGRIGADVSDERLSALVDFALELRGEHGLWSYAEAPQCDRWLSFHVLLSLSRIERSKDWLSFEPRTPFAPYPRKQRRF